MNRIVEKFAHLKAAGKKALVVYIGAGDPHLAATRDLALAFDRAGVDVLELGVPFSDPLADGLVNQLAAQRGLESGTTPPKLLATVTEIRQESQIPIVFYIYFNLIHKVGMAQFIADAAKAGVDGLLVLDLPAAGGHLQNVNAETNVVIDFTDESGQTHHVTSARAVYAYNVVGAVTNETVTFTGNPKVESAESTILSEPLVWDRAANKFHFHNETMIFRQNLNGFGGGTNGSPKL